MDPAPTDNTVAVIAIVVSGGVALLAAVVAPVTAHYRQKAAFRAERERLDRQLSEERSRLDDQLAAERERLQLQLQHDRSLVDLDEVRQLLDTAVEGVEQAENGFALALAHARSLRADPARDRVPVVDAANAAFRAILPLADLVVRLELRLGQDHPAAAACRGLWNAYYSWRYLLVESNLPPSDDILAQYDRCLAEIGAAKRQFIVEGHALAGTRYE